MSNQLEIGLLAALMKRSDGDSQELQAEAFKGKMNPLARAKVVGCGASLMLRLRQQLHKASG